MLQKVVVALVFLSLSLSLLLSISEGVSILAKTLDESHTQKRKAQCPWVPTCISMQHVHRDHVAGGKLPELLGWLEVDYQGDGEAENVAAV